MTSRQGAGRHGGAARDGGHGGGAVARAAALLPAAALLAAAQCPFDYDAKVPITNVNAGFTLADATWFEQEQTLFFFYRVDAEQGIGADSRIEVSWRTDDEIVPTTPLSALDAVHTHLAVDCGPRSRCGSFSVHVPLPPRDVQMLLRYHAEGEVTLDAPLSFSEVGVAPPHLGRSLLVYGIFDEGNRRTQWRARHQFPRIRNEEAQGLGLRRRFDVDDTEYGDVARALITPDNPYGYGLFAACPAGLTATGHPPVSTEERAIFSREPLPLAASPTNAACGSATVTDALGTFTTAAFAFKNPEVAPAFPSLRSPVTENTQVAFLLQQCERDISADHLAMQIQRLQLEDAPVICVDDFAAPGFIDGLADTLTVAIDDERGRGSDMVLVLALHHDDATGGLADGVEEVLARVFAEEASKSSPRVSGAFVLDSVQRGLSRGELARHVLWCPSASSPDDLDDITSAVAVQCALQPDQELALGPFRFFTSLPVFPSRRQYVTFVDKYGEGQAGRVLDLSFRAPSRTPLSIDVPVGDFAVATFFNNEVITAEPSDAFSFCAPGEDDAPLPPVVFVSDEIFEPLPLEFLPEVHAAAPQRFYALGLLWIFPYLFQVEYETLVGGAVTAFDLTVPFGIASPSDQFFGADQWTTGEFPLDQILLRCRRFCDHPTFDSAGVYNVRVLFAESFRNECYRPQFPVPGSGGFPRDP